MKAFSISFAFLLGTASTAGNFTQWDTPTTFSAKVYQFELNRQDHQLNKTLEDLTPTSYGSPIESKFNSGLKCWRDDHSDTGGCQDFEGVIYKPSNGKCSSGFGSSYKERIDDWTSWAIYHDTAQATLNSYGLVELPNWGWEKSHTYEKLGYAYSREDFVYNNKTGYYQFLPIAVEYVYLYVRPEDNALIFTERRASRNKTSVHYFEGGLAQASYKMTMETFFDYLPYESCNFAYKDYPNLHSQAEEITIEIYTETVLAQFGSVRDGKLSMDKAQLTTFVKELDRDFDSVKTFRIMNRVDKNRDELVDQQELADYITKLNII